MKTRSSVSFPAVQPADAGAHSLVPGAGLLSLAVALPLLTVAAVPGAVQAQTPAQAQTQAPSAADSSRAYEVPAGTLEQALTEFGRQAGVLLNFTSDLVQGRQSPGLKGPFTVDQGFAALLVDSGLQVARESQGSYVLRRLPVPGDQGDAAVQQLAVVRVSATSWKGEQTEGTTSYTLGRSNVATGLGLSLRQTPQSATVVTRERMDDQRLLSVAEVVNQVPGVFADLRGPAVGGRSSLYSRGYELSNYQIDGATSALSLEYQEGLDTAIYDSVTVVRGATGLLSGAGDPSGTISLSRKRPGREFQAIAELSLDRWSRRRLMADLGGALNEAGTVRGRLIAVHDEGGFHIPSYDGDRQVLFGVIEADLGPRTWASLSLEQGWQKSNSGSDVMGAPMFFTDDTLTPFGRYDSHYPDWGLFHRRKTNVTATFDHAFNDDWRFKANLSYGRGSFALKEAFPAELSRDDMVFNHTAAIFSDVDNRSHSYDFRLNGAYRLWGRKHDLVAGLNGGQSRDHSNAWAYIGMDSLASLDNGRLVFPEPDWEADAMQMLGQYRTRESGLFVATRLRPTDSLSLLLGSRWSNWRYSSQDLLFDEQVPDRKYSGVFSPYAGVVYDLSSQLSGYASYTEIFSPQRQMDVNGRLLDPEEGSNREVGIKGEWLNGRLNASVAVFEVRKDNLAVRDGENRTPQGGFAYRAEDNTTGRGWELEVAGEPMPGLNLQAGYSRMVMKDSAGERFNPDRPVHQFKVFAAYQPRSLPRLRFGGGLTWQSRRYSAFDEGFRREAGAISSYTLVNLMTSWEVSDRMSLMFNVYNALNQDYRTETGYLTYGPKRHVMTTLRYRF